MKKNRLFKSAKKFLLLCGLGALSLLFIPKAFTQAPWLSNEESRIRTKTWKDAETAKKAQSAESAGQEPSSLQFLSEGTWNSGEVQVEAGSFAPSSNN